MMYIVSPRCLPDAVRRSGLLVGMMPLFAVSESGKSRSPSSLSRFVLQFGVQAAHELAELLVRELLVKHCDE